MSAGLTLDGLDLSGTDDQGVEWVVGDVTGWGSPKGTLNVQQKPRGHGGYSGESFLTPRVLAWQGSLHAQRPEDARDALDRLYAAASLDEVELIVREADSDRRIVVRREDEVIPSWLTDTDVRYSVQMVADDPRKLGGAVSVTTALPSSSGGAHWPARFPLRFNGVSVSGLISVRNVGNIVAPVRLRIAGPVVGPSVVHRGSGRQLVFASGLTLGAGEWLDVDMDNRTVLANGQASRNGWITSRGWFGVEPGDNDIGFNAQTYSAGARLTVDTYSGAWQ